MRQSQLFSKTSRDFLKDEVSFNAKLLSRAGFVDKLMAGAYSYLPLGLRVLRKIENIVREEMNRLGSQEILMPTLHPKNIWQQTGAWDTVDVLFKITSRTKKEYALAQSAEEVVAPLVMKYIGTYQDLPKSVYQIHWKYRDELRSKSGLMRGVEFLMKDMYSFHVTQEDFELFYEGVKQAYFKIFNRLSLDAKATEASGGNFTEKISYEFMVRTSAGEDDILYCQTCDFCVNVEIAQQVVDDGCPKCTEGILGKAVASEVGNVFDLGKKYGKDFGLTVDGRDGEKIHPIMGCYGIGISRLMGVLAEIKNDEKGLIWPVAVAPFTVHLIPLQSSSMDIQEKIIHTADALYLTLVEHGIEVLYDDRKQLSVGEKFNDCDLIGIPYRFVLSEKTISSPTNVEVKLRSQKQAEIYSIQNALELVKKR